MSTVNYSLRHKGVRLISVENGMDYRYKIKLARESDKALLNMLLQQKQHAMLDVQNS